jgi:hypothetical protein
LSLSNIKYQEHIKIIAKSYTDGKKKEVTNFGTCENPNKIWVYFNILYQNLLTLVKRAIVRGHNASILVNYWIMNRGHPFLSICEKNFSSNNVSISKGTHYVVTKTDGSVYYILNFC